MKSILITGEKSFVGNSISEYLGREPEKYSTTAISLRDGTWREMDFSRFDCVYHVAGLAHSDTRAVTAEEKQKYYAVNTDLTAEIAQKAKADGVKQFIFMSSAIVYGVFDSENLIGYVWAYEHPFREEVRRKGNFPILEKLAMKLPVFPKVENKRSMLYIGNLAEFVRLMIENEESGVFWPCNKEWSNTSELVQMIAACHGKNTILIPGFSWALKALSHVSGYVDKAFGNLTFEENLGDYKEDYRLYSLEKSIEETER